MSATRGAPLEEFTGTIITPESPDYVKMARTALAMASPVLVLRPADTADVQRAVRFAASSGREVAVRGGGHSAAGFGTVDDGIVIDLGALHEVRMLDERRVRVGGGATWRHVLDVLAPLGLAISSGDTADVGVGGLTLSGGIGWMVRRDGLALDQLRAIELVTVDGEILRADAEHHVELFWALRGGGGAFGIVTVFEFEAQPGGEVDLIRLTFPANEAKDVAAGWLAHMRTAPDEISSTLVLADPLSGGREAPIQITAVVSGGADAAATASALSCAGTVLTQTVQRLPYAEVLHEGAELPPFLRVAARSHFVPDDRADDMVEAVAALAQREHPLPFTLHALGGAFGRVDEADTAFAHRDAALLVTTFSVVPADALAGVRAAQEQAWRSLQGLTSGAYANSLDGTSAAAVAAIYPAASRARLSVVKAQYDPRGLLSRNFGPVGTLSGAGEDDV